MGRLKTWLVGVAIAITGATSGFAADPGLSAPHSVDYVRLCDAYGTGFFYIPGTETCLRVSGYVRFDATAAEPAFWDKGWRTPIQTVLAGVLRPVGGRDYNYYSTLARARIEFDARTSTEYGPLRSFIQVQNTIGNLPFRGIHRDDTFITQPHLFPSFERSTVDNLVELRSGFIQFGGLTAGRAFSFYNLPYFSTFSSPMSADGFANLIAYTFSADKLSATLSVEDGTDHRELYRTSARRPNPAPGQPGFDQQAYGGHTLPDVVGAIAYEDTWGSLKLAGALHHIHLADPAFDDALGYAVQVGGEIFIPTSAAPGSRDRIYGGFVYTRGATAYSGLSADEDRFGGAAGFSVFDGQGYIDSLPLGIPTTKEMLATVWGGHLGLQHHWSPVLQSTVSVSVLRASDAFFVPGDFTQSRFVANLIWNPTQQMRIGFEVLYDRTDFDDNITEPFKQRFGEPIVSSFDKLQAILRVQRAF